MGKTAPKTRPQQDWWQVGYRGSGERDVWLEGYECPEPWECHCLAEERDGGEVRRCGYTTEEARAQVVAHYQRYADYYRGLSDEDFLQSMGVYRDPR